MIRYSKVGVIGEAYEDTRGISEAERVRMNQKHLSVGEGLISAGVYLNNSFSVEKKIQKIIRESGYQDGEIDYGINWDYMTASVSEMGIENIMIFVVILLLILVSGYLIIYN